MAIHPRLINQLFENPEFLVAPDSLGYVVRDMINMNWWNTCGVLLGYKKNKRVNGDFSEVQKRIAVQLKEYYYVRRIAIKNESKFRQEIRGYLIGNVKKIEQLNAFSYMTRMNPSQYFHKKNGTPTWVDCTSRATYAAKYVFQNGYQDFDGRARFLGASAILDAIETGRCEDLGISEYFDDGHNTVKAEIFSQKNSQLSVGEWIDRLGVKILPKREWLLDAIGHVKSDPYKINESRIVAQGLAPGVNELLYGFSTSSSVKLAMAVSAASAASTASDASRARAASRASAASHASYASYASTASDASYASRASNASKASTASNASHASHASTASGASYASAASAASGASKASTASGASNASGASGASYASHASAASRASTASGASNAANSSDAGCTHTAASVWSKCDKAIKKPDHLDYPPVFRKNIFGLAGNWKINADIVNRAKIAYLDPFSGHGTSPLYAKKHGINYLGFDTNKKAFDEYLNIINEECSGHGSNVKVQLQDSTEFLPKLVGQFDLCYTSPPYFNFEEYGGNTAHYDDCKSYADFHKKITIPVFTNVYEYLVPGGTLALQTEKNATAKKEWIDVIKPLGFILESELLTGIEKQKYSTQSKRDQNLLVFRKPSV